MDARTPLDIDRITRAAVELLDEVGLSGLSTRRLAAKLGVRSPTLYWHVRDKAALLDLVAEAVCADAFDIDASLPWCDQLADGLRQFRALLLAHRDVAELLRERPPTGPHRLGHVETTLRILLGAGFDGPDAAAISRLLTAHVLSSVPPPRPRPDPAELAAMRERMAAYPSLRRVAPEFDRQDPGAVFELGVQVILDGLAARLAQPPPPGPPR
ncbi:TetR/AcrR family transcriptional regulator C-terminal domain-containing protein [Pseudonocardia humida]|uniref:TetR/AcrR family transcriptional regulator C-terminal domain-containing protein n=1 Tax=Pseudonocardia humida TaxID=2800819 RepID=A0ABT0ZSM7_9PSEU|nr:TetR/AcrR family transcriptional regulator C-terminal domain-containing protein [Pseudonocardia humida]MCO1653742.1 TetR/AcrR family transcriptional regulator C-terminal domain-containing protein [Pseudonocardia humida]